MGTNPYLRGVAKYLNAMLAGQANIGGATYVDTATSSIGHDYCALDKWVEGFGPHRGGGAGAPQRQGHGQHRQGGGGLHQRRRSELTRQHRALRTSVARALSSGGFGATGRQP